MKKKCTRCKLEKDSSQFCKDKRTKDGLYSDCRKCHYFFYGRWEYHKKYRQEGLRRIKYRKYRRKYDRELRKNPKNRIDHSMSLFIGIALKGRKAGRSWQKLVGYTIEDLIVHLEKQFDEKMTLDNYGSYWWIDHRKPRSLFKYETTEDPEFKKCWALENLQPMEKIANIKKGNHYQPK